MVQQQKLRLSTEMLRLSTDVKPHTIQVFTHPLEAIITIEFFPSIIRPFFENLIFSTVKKNNQIP